MENGHELKFLIKAKYGSNKKFAEKIGVSENTVNAHLKDGKWDMYQAVKIAKALDISPNLTYVYFFEPALAKVASEMT